uniref:RRM domain-containing protein n=1 Tax=Panagrolaimus davidi TaxID=227884 RepID=A0A914PHF3_9BILA
MNRCSGSQKRMNSFKFLFVFTLLCFGIFAQRFQWNLYDGTQNGNAKLDKLHNVASDGENYVQEGDNVKLSSPPTTSTTTNQNSTELSQTTEPSEANTIIWIVIGVVLFIVFAVFVIGFVFGIGFVLIIAAYGAPPLTTSVSTAAAGTPSVSSIINSKDPSMVKARVFVGNLNTSRVSREDLVELFEYFGNVSGATLSKGYAFVQFSSQTEAELCVQTLNGFTWEESELVVKILTLYSTNDAIDRPNLLNDIKIKNASGTVKEIVSNKQKYFNQHTTNFIVCSSDSLKPLNVEN